MTEFDYGDAEWQEIRRTIRAALPAVQHLTKADLESDFKGIDGSVICNYRCPLALRLRRDRPWYASDADITFRSTERSKIAGGTYAPLALFMWMNGGRIVAGKLVDVYRMQEHLDPPLKERSVQSNGDGTGFVAVEIWELVKTGALLRQGGASGWAAACTGGDMRTSHILEKDVIHV